MSQEWQAICKVDDIPVMGARVVVRGAKPDVAIFRNSENKIFALLDKCPHKGGPLSQGIVSGHSVTCPLHNWVVALDTGDVKGPDKGCARKVKLVIEDGRIFMEAAALRRDAA